MLAGLAGLVLSLVLAPAALAACTSVSTSTAWKTDRTSARTWTTADNWTNGVPQACSAVSIAPDVSPSPLTLTGIPASLELSSLSVGRGVELNDGHLTTGDLVWTIDSEDGSGYNSRLDGQLTVTGDASITATAGSNMFMSGGTLTANGDTTIQSADLHFGLAGGGDLDFDGPLTVNGSVDVDGAAAGTAEFSGGLTLSGLSASLALAHMDAVELTSTLTLPVGSTLDLTDSTTTLGAGAALSGPGTVSSSGNSASLAFPGSVPLSNGATLVFGSGSLTGPGGPSGTGTFSWLGGTMEGSVTLGSGITTTASGADQKFLGSDVAVTNQGSFTLVGGVVLNFVSGIPTFANTGTLAGAGTIEADVTNSGLVAPAGTLTVDGDYEQQSGGELRVDVLSTGADRLAVIGSSVATLAGTLRIVHQSGFEPANGTTYDVVTYPSRSGNFGNVRGRIIDSDQHYEVASSATETRLTVSPGGGPLLTLSDAQAGEGSALDFVISLSAAAEEPVTVSYATSDGSAGGDDYTPTSGQLTIPTGQTQGHVSVPTTQDTGDEPDETLTLTLSAPDQAAIADGTATGTIVDDDPTPQPEPQPQPQPDVGTGPGPGQLVPLPVPIGELCTGSTTLTVGAFAVTGCFAKSGDRYTAAGDVEVNGLLLRPAAGTGKIVVDLAAKTIEGSLAGTDIDAFTPREAGTLPSLLGRLEKIAAAQQKAVWDLAKPVGQLAAKITAKALEIKGVRLLADRVMEIRARVEQRLEAQVDASLKLLGNAFAKLKLGFGKATANARAIVGTVAAQAALLNRFQLHDLALEYNGTEWVGTGKLLLGLSETGLEVRFGPQGITRAHAESLGELQLLSGIYLDKYALDLFDINGTWRLVGLATISGRTPSGTLVSGGDHAIDYTIAPDGRWTLTTAGSGASVGGQNLSNLTFTVKSSGAFDFAGGLELQNKFGRFVSATASGWFDPPTRMLSLSGGGRLTLVAPGVGPDVTAAGTISPRGWAACTSWTVTALGVTVTVSVGLGQKAGELPTLFASSCDLTAYQAVRPAARAAQAGGTTVDVPKGLPLAAFAVRGAGGPPTVILTGPDGQVIPAASGQVQAGKVLAVEDAEASTTHLLLGAPPAGRFTIAAAEGSAPIAGVQMARGLVKPNVKAKVSGKGRRRVLSWTANANQGQRISFFEEGGGTRHAIGRTQSAAKGRIRFTPADAAAGKRSIVAVVEQGGLPRETSTAGSYRAPAARPVAVPRRVRARHAKTRVTLTWKGGRGIASYRVTVRPRGSSSFMVVARRARVVLRDIPARQSGTLTVQAVGRDGRLSRLGRGRFRAAR